MNVGEAARSRWAWAAGGAVAVVGLIVTLFSLSKPPVKRPTIEIPAKGMPPALALTSMKDEAALLDPAALFLPTKWSAGQKEVPWPEPGGAFQNYGIEPKLAFTNADPKVPLPVPVAPPASPAAAISVIGPGPLALGFGRAEAKIDPLPLRGAFIGIVSTRTGQKALLPRELKEVERLAAEARPPPADRPWQPFDFLAAVDAAGLVGPLVIVEPRSGVEEVDRYFQDFLVRTVRIGERLAPGSYRISVGP